MESLLASNMIGSEPHGSLNDSIRAVLLQLIQEGALRAGDRLPSEARLCSQLGVSRAALREALRGMEGSGYLESRTGSGWYVKEFSFDAVAEGLSHTLSLDRNALKDLCEIRLLLETYLIEKAIPTLTAEDLDALEDAVDEMEHIASRSGFAFSGPDYYFHRKLYSHLDNQVAMQLLDVFWKLYAGFHAKHGECGDPILEARKHRHIVNAIRAGDVELARQRLRESLEAKSKRVKSAEEPPADPVAARPGTE